MGINSNQPSRIHNLEALTYCKRKIRKIDSRVNYV
jgi:hypothetical protein